jgi:hypothetical protein
VPGRTFTPEQRARSARTRRARLLLQHLDRWRTDSAVPDDELTTTQRRVFEVIRQAARRPIDPTVDPDGSAS